MGALRTISRKYFPVLLLGVLLLLTGSFAACGHPEAVASVFPKCRRKTLEDIEIGDIHLHYIVRYSCWLG